jgi:hypothetical protein
MPALCLPASPDATVLFDCPRAHGYNAVDGWYSVPDLLEIDMRKYRFTGFAARDQVNWVLEHFGSDG